MVFVEESAEDFLASDVVGGERDDVPVVCGSVQVQGTVGSSGVVVRGVAVEDASQVALVVDEDVVGAF